MSWVEEAVLFDCAGETLVGIFALPQQRTPAVAVLVVVGGPQYRAGAHRQFVHLSRTLAGAGHAVLRFDYRGMGDASGAQRDFEGASEDIARALDTLCSRVPAAREVVVFGLCDGASAALLYLHDTRDARVSGLCLLNPWARSDETLARTHLKHYYLRRLGDAEFWRKVLRGQVGLERLREFMRSVRLVFGGSAAGTTAAPGAARTLGFRAAMAQAWRRFDGRILLALSSEDLTAREFTEHAAAAPDWRGLLDRPQVQRLTIAGADHTLSEPQARAAFEDAVCGWLLAPTR